MFTEISYQVTGNRRGVVQARCMLSVDLVWFMANRYTLRKVIYGNRCDRPNATIGGEWNDRIDAGEVTYWSRLQ